MSIIFTDIDHFKRINDTHGHAVGDAVLKHFAQMVASMVRSTDRVVRWGGEEFLIVCMNTTGQQAATLAEKLREHMGMQAWPAGLSVTASFGVAEHLPAEDIGEVIERADAGLYAAKRAGRNRVHVHGPQTVAGQAGVGHVEV
jgi:diguanylate cyclase (GGDEF)-like protein